MVEDRRRRMEEFVEALREQFQITLDLQRQVTALRLALEKDAKFRETYGDALANLEHDDTKKPNNTRLAQILDAFAAAKRLL